MIYAGDATTGGSHECNYEKQKELYPKLQSIPSFHQPNPYKPTPFPYVMSVFFYSNKLQHSHGHAVSDHGDNFNMNLLKATACLVAFKIIYFYILRSGWGMSASDPGPWGGESLSQRYSDDMSWGGIAWGLRSRSQFVPKHNTLNPFGFFIDKLTLSISRCAINHRSDMAWQNQLFLSIVVSESLYWLIT